jgi:hypothetical protein
MKIAHPCSEVLDTLDLDDAQLDPGAHCSTRRTGSDRSMLPAMATSPQETPTTQVELAAYVYQSMPRLGIFCPVEMYLGECYISGPLTVILISLPVSLSIFPGTRLNSSHSLPIYLFLSIRETTLCRTGFFDVHRVRACWNMPSLSLW